MKYTSDIKSYKSNKVLNVLGNYADEITVINSTTDDENAIAAANAILASIAEKVKKQFKHGIPFDVAQSCAVVVNCRQSLASDICGVYYGKQVTGNIILVSHNAVNIIINSKVDKKLVDKLSRFIIANLVENGIVFNGKHYVFVDANNTQLKNGEFFAVEENTWNRVRNALNIVSIDEINAAGGDNGSEYLKRMATLFTPSGVIMDEDGNGIKVSDITVVDDIEIKRLVKRVLEVNPDKGTSQYFKEYLLEMTMADGMAMGINVDIPSHQERAWNIKAEYINCHKIYNLMVKKGLIDPEHEVETLGNRKVKVKDIKILMTKSCWKANKLGLSPEEIAHRLDVLSSDYPTINLLRAVRWSFEDVEDVENENEKPVRLMSRQSLQGMFTASDSELYYFVKPVTRRANKYTTAKSYAKTFRNTAMEGIITKYPELLASDQMIGDAEANYMTTISKGCAGRVPVEGRYPYLCMDPVAILEILLGGKNADEVRGIVAAGEVYVPGFEDNEKLFTVRYPSNHIVGSVVVNHTYDDLFSEIGNVAVLSYNDQLIVRMDGDFDGDEALFTNDKRVISFYENVLRTVNMPLITFPHKKADRFPIDADGHNLNVSIEKALYNGQKFNLVGRYSNLATKILNTITPFSTREQIRTALNECTFAHVGTILVIDAVKTGTLPEGLVKVLDKLLKKYTKMPWNQRFTAGLKKDFSDDSWDEETQPMSNSVCDRLALQILRMTNWGEFTYDRNDMVFDPHILMNANEKTQAFGGFVRNSYLKSLNDSRYSDQDAEVVNKINAGDRVKPGDLMKFFFKNAAALERGLVGNPDAKNIRDDYYKAVKDILVSLDTRNNPYILANHFVKTAFEIGMKDNRMANNNGTDLQIRAEKGRFCRFVLSVFAEEIESNINTNLGLDTIMDIDESDLAF